MTTKPKVKRFRVRRQAAAEGGTPDPVPETEAATTSATEAPRDLSQAEQIAAISQEGLTGRQLRMARRVALKHGFQASSDYDAVRQLRAAGIDPFQRSSVLELVKPETAKGISRGSRNLIPQATPEVGLVVNQPASTEVAIRNASEIRQIQIEIAQRRRRKLALMLTRLAVFIFLPTFMVGWYFYNIATPMYATNSEIVIQQAQPQGGSTGGLGSLFQGTSMATQQDSIAVQSYLASREALLRLDQDHGFKAHFSDPSIDPIQRLAPDASNEEAFDLYTRQVSISYDPTEGIIRMEVAAADPEKAFAFSQALIGYAEEQVDQLTARLRGDQMRGARESYEEAERRREDALAEWLAIQQQVRQIDSSSGAASRMSLMNTLRAQRLELERTLEARLSVERPSEAQVNSLRNQLALIDNQIAGLENELVGGGDDQASVVVNNTELRKAEENYNFQTMMVQQALTQMETARIEANRQVRYLSQSVRPVIPDQPAYPRAFENTLLALLIFAGLYLMISITASVLREQVSA